MGAAATPVMPGVWAWLRAALIALVLFVQAISATPSQPFSPERLARPEGQRFVSAVETGLAAIGATVERAAIEQGLIAVTRRAIKLRRALLAPFDPMLEGLASRQQWGLFLMSGGEYFRMHVEAQTTTRRFAPVYIAGELDQAGVAASLRYRRLRGIYNPSIRRGPSREYDGFVSWLARELFRSHPDYVAVRVRMEHLALPDDRSPPRRVGFEHVRTRRREAAP